MIALAIDKAGSTDPVQVAYALEGMKYGGPSGESGVRGEDHQTLTRIYVMNIVKAGQQGVKYDEEGTGYGWKTEALIEAKDAVPPVKCKMERPLEPRLRPMTAFRRRERRLRVASCRSDLSMQSRLTRRTGYRTSEWQCEWK